MKLGENMRYIGLFSIDEYAEDGGGLQKPLVLDATSMKDAKEEAIAIIKRRGQKHGEEDNDYSVDSFRIFEVAGEWEIDIKALNAELRYGIEAKKNNVARQKEIDHMSMLIRKHLDEAKKIIRG